MHKLISFIFLNVLFSTALLFSSESLEKVSLQLQWKHQFEFAGFYIAKEKGYYKDAGLEVTLKEYRRGVNSVDDVCSGESTFGVNYPSLILNRAQGKNIVLLSAILQSSPHVLVSLKSSGIQSIEDFKNRRLMTNAVEIETASFSSMFKANGLNAHDMIKLPHSFSIDDLVNKKTDLISAFRSNELYTLDKRGIEYHVWDPKDYGFDFYDVLLFTNGKVSVKNPKMVKAFRDASLKGYRYAFEHIEETVDLILHKYNTQHKTKDALVYEAKILKGLALVDGVELGHIDKNKIQRIYDIYNLLGATTQKINLDKFIFHAQDKQALLSKEEREYLKKKKVIRMCVDPEWMPFGKIENGKHIGLSADYFKLFQKELDIPIALVQTKTWTQSLNLAKTKKCDILSLVMQTPQRKKYLNFSEAYLSIPLVIATKIDEPFINDMGSLSYQKVGIPKGYAFAELLKVKYPNLNIVDVKNIRDGLQKVHSGELFGYIGTLASVGYHFQKEFVGELKIAGKFDENWNLGVGVRDDDTVLLEIFNKLIKNIDTKKRQEILNNWISIKYEKGMDYALAWKILALLVAVLLFGAYRNSILKKLNKNLQKAKKRADDKALEAEFQRENFKTMLDTAIEGIGIFEDGSCVDINDSALEMFGFKSKEEVLGKSALIFVAPVSVELVIKNIQDKYDKEYEIVAIKADGTEFPALIRGTTYSVEGRVRRLSNILDLTPFKKSEEELIKAKDLAEEATKTKANFLANMSHEIRTPMNGIAGMLHLLGKTSLNEKQLEYVHKLKTASNNLLYMINDLLDYSKLEAGKLEVHKVDFDMNRVIENIKDLLELKATQKGLEFSLDSFKKDSIFYGDSLRITQVLINLTNNAIKFTESGEIKISVECREVDIVRFSVKDSGIGIKREKQEELFQSFNQIDSGITRKYGGSGLGLSVSKELVELMGGKIWLESELGKGSEFIFEITLPKGNIKNVDKLDLHTLSQRSSKRESEIDKEDISQKKRDELFHKLTEVLKTSRPKSCFSVIEEMRKYNFSDKDAKIFTDIQVLIKKYRYKDILKMLDGYNEK